MKEGKRPLILVSNDDGYQAPGVRALIEMLLPIGEVIAVCPDSPRSGGSMAITVNQAMRVTRISDFDLCEMYAVNGSPSDCVKLGMYAVLKGRCPDLVVAGINHGSNAAVNVVYSGTMGATFEGCAFGIPSIGFSLTDHSMDANFEPCRPFVRKIVEDTLRNGLPQGVCLNVNIPNSEKPPVEMRVVRSAIGKWSDEYKEYTDPSGKPFYWLTGQFINSEPNNSETDEWCLAHGIVSVVPSLLDRTAPKSQSPEWLVDWAMS